MIVTTVTGATNKPGFGRPWLRAADIVIMMHPDYRCTPLLVTAMACMAAYDVYEAVPGSRIIGGGSLKGGMPLYKCIANRFLTAFENLMLGAKMSAHHTGYRIGANTVALAGELG